MMKVVNNMIARIKWTIIIIIKIRSSKNQNGNTNNKGN